MSDNTFPMKPNEQIETKFGIVFFCIDEDTIEVHFINFNNETLRVAQNVAEVFYYIIKELHQINPSLIFQKGSVKNCYYFSKTRIDITIKLNQHKVFWLYIQGTAIKVQLSSTFRALLNQFYQLHENDFNNLLNTDTNQFTSFINGQAVNAKRYRNSIATLKGRETEEWYNFNLVDNKAIPFIFEFFGNLPILRP